jgi:hypothetical protein
MVGQCRHPAVSKVSVELPLQQCGYSNVPVSVSRAPF